MHGALTDHRLHPADSQGIKGDNENDEFRENSSTNITKQILVCSTNAVTPM